MAGASASAEGVRPVVDEVGLGVGNSAVPRSEHCHLAFFCFFSQALSCGPSRLGLGLPIHGFSSAAFGFHVGGFDS